MLRWPEAFMEDAPNTYLGCNIVEPGFNASIPGYARVRSLAAGTFVAHGTFAPNACATAMPDINPSS